MYVLNHLNATAEIQKFLMPDSSAQQAPTLEQTDRLSGKLVVFEVEATNCDRPWPKMLPVIRMYAQQILRGMILNKLKPIGATNELLLALAKKRHEHKVPACVGTLDSQHQCCLHITTPCLCHNANFFSQQLLTCMHVRLSTCKIALGASTCSA